MRWLASLLLLIILLGLGWLATRTDSPAPAVEPAAAPIEPTVASVQPSPVSALPETGALRSEEPAGESPTSAEQPTAETEVAALEPLESGGLLVRVLDSAGQPSPNVQVSLFMRVTGAGSDDRGRTMSRAPDGLARIELKDLDQLRAQLEVMKMKVDFSVMADFASPSPVEVPLDGWPKDGDEVELRLPPTGSILVHATHADGTHVSDELSLGWWWLPADVAASKPREGYERVRHNFARGKDGSVRIDGMGLGLALQLQLTVTGYQAAQEKGALGPTEPGEVVEFHMALGEPFAKAHVRVLDTTGAPVGSTKIRCERWDDPDQERHPASGRPRAATFSFETDEAGYGSFLLVPGTVTIKRRVDFLHGRYEDEHWSIGSAWLPQTVLAGETVDLGVVNLEPAQVLCEGTVVDTSGAPVPRARLAFQTRHGKTREHRWYNHEWLFSEADGSFLLKGIREPLELRVMATAQGYKQNITDPLVIGDRAYLIELEPESAEAQTGAVELKVLLDDDVPSMRCLLKLANDDGGGRSPDWFAGTTMEVKHLRPGTYDVFVETRDGDFELGRVSGIKVRAGETTIDPRLSPFDLRGTAHAVTLHLTRPDGAPWRRADIVIEAEGTRGSLSTETDDRGIVTVILPQRVAAIQVALSRENIKRVTIPPTPEGLISVRMAEE